MGYDAVMRVSVHGPNLPFDGPTFHIHAEGCGDTKKAHYKGADRGGWSMEAGSVEEVVSEAYSDIMAENEGDLAQWEAYANDFLFFPCVNHLPYFAAGPVELTTEFDSEGSLTVKADGVPIANFEAADPKTDPEGVYVVVYDDARASGYCFVGTAVVEGNSARISETLLTE